MKTLIIPDIHCKWKAANAIITHYVDDVDEIVMLGDYFDNFHDTPTLNRDTAKWLKTMLDKPKLVAIIGNHELNYAYNGPYKCAGYSDQKKKAINKVMSISDWDKLVPYHFTQGWLLTHAGVTRKIGEKWAGWSEENFRHNVDRDRNAFRIGHISPYFRAGMFRGGPEDRGGINWCHYPEEFQPIDGVKQIFGHTQNPKVRQYRDTDNWCIDTTLRHCGLITNGNFEILDTTEFRMIK